MSAAGVGRIVMIAPHFPEYAYLLSLALAREAEVLLVIDEGLLNREYEGRPRPVSPKLTISHNRFETVGELLRLFRALLRFRPDVIHWQEPSGLKKSAFAAATTLLARPFARLALTIHDPVPHAGRDAAIARRLARFRRFTRGRVHRVFVHGPICRDQYLHQYLTPPGRDERLRLTEHGLILAGAADGEPEGSFSVLMFGRMEAYKGLDVLCGAIEQLAGEGRELRLTLAGAGPEIERLAERFTRRPHVTIENRFLSSAEVVERIRAAHCVVLPYTSATQSGVLAAAFGNGRPVVASRVGGIPDLVRDGTNGLLVEPNDAAGLAAAIRRLWDDEALRARLRIGARETAASLDWGPIAARMARDY